MLLGAEFVTYPINPVLQLDYVVFKLIGYWSTVKLLKVLLKVFLSYI